MPQIKGEHRGALVQFLKGRGIGNETVDVPAIDLKPTQAEFSIRKAANWKEARDGVDRSVLASSDGYILDGHHQWVAALAAGEPVKAIRFAAPIKELLAAANEFPGARRSEGAAQKSREDVRREVIEKQWQDALADLGAILRDYAPVARMVPEDTPSLMPTLVKLFEAGFGKVGMKITDLMRYVKAELKKTPEFKTVWNKIDDAIYRKAAMQALENHRAAPQGDLFATAVEKETSAQGDLFAQQSAAVDAGKEAKSEVGRYIPPASTGEARSRWGHGAEMTPQKRTLMASVKRALDAGLFYNTDVNNFVAKELGVTDAEREIGAQSYVDADGRNHYGVAGGSFGYEVYLARKEAEKEAQQSAAVKAKDDLGLRVGENIGRIMTSGKIGMGATVESLGEFDATLIFSRGGNKYRITLPYQAVESASNGAKSDYFARKRQQIAKPVMAPVNENGNPAVNTETASKSAPENSGKQGDLFAQQSAAVDIDPKPKSEPKPAPKKDMMMVDGVEYDIDAPNFGMPVAPLTLKPGDHLLVHTDKKALDSTVFVRSVVAPAGVEMTRAEMHQAIEDYHFRNAVSAPAERKPIAYVMGGGGASGKGTIKRQLQAEGLIGGDNTVGLDADEIKEMIGEYRQIVDAGDSRAAEIVHEESSALSKRIKARAIAGRFDMVLDVTLGDEAKGIKALQELTDAGYEVRLFGVTVRPETAVIRAGLRARDSKRYVPYDALLRAHRGFAGAWETYADMADVAVLYENTDGRHKLAEKVDGNLVLHDEQAYNEFAERRNINERAETLGEIGGLGEGRAGIARQDRGSQATAGRTEASGSTGRRDSGGERRNGPGADSERLPQEPGEKGRLNDQPADTGARRTQGQEPGAVQGTAGAGRAERLPGRADAGDSGRSAQPGARDRAGAGLQRTTEERSDAGSRGDEHGARPGARGSVRRNAGIPAGRDIPAKTGRNFAFGDGDLTYEGSWLAKAGQNVEAVELLKQLEKDGRQASREEQAKLARFIGWGASDLANNLFGDKLDKQAQALERYDRAAEAMERFGRGYLARNDAGFYDAFMVLSAKDGALNYYQVSQITKEQLAKVKPDPAARKWAALRDRLKAALTPEEWKEASRSTQYAHYTSRPIVRAMWDALARMGFKGGSILEPGAGIGVFPGLMASPMANSSLYTGIEFDSITGGILKQLFPDERILVESFVDSKLPKNFYDVGAGNPPFNSTAVLADPQYKKHAFALHDYFFAKTIDSVKPGGLVMFVTSRYTMDKLNDKARSYLAERADLVGAIRLPQTAFRKNAGTDVVTDVLFLRKKVDGETFAHAQSWAKSVPMPVGKKSFPVNEYFHAHPEMILGTPSDKGKMANSPEPQYTVEAIDGDIDALFAKAAATLPADIYRAERGSDAEAAAVREIDFNPKAQKEGNFYITDAGVLMQREGGVGVRADEQRQKNVALIKDFVTLRDALKQAHYDQLNDGEWEKSLGALKKAYTAFVKKHGQINQFTEMRRTVKATNPDTGETFDDERSYKRFPLLSKIDSDPDYSVVMALESINDETGEITESHFLSERVLGKPASQEIRTPADALLSVLNDIGHVDVDAIADRLGMDRLETVDALGSMIYEDPAAGWAMADEYLSGNVKKKLRAAREAAKNDRRYERNVDALLTVQPTPVPPADITVAIGMNWIPAEVYAQFLHEKTGIKAKVIYNERTGQWAVEAQSSTGTLAATQEWGTPRRSADDILLAALTGAPIRITETVKEPGGGSKTVFLADATEAANQKLAQMREAFSGWMWQDGERTDKLVALYNDTFNTIVPRSFDGRHLSLPGTSKKWSVFDHVKRGAWRIIQTGNTYLAHAVGSGKTFQMIISAMEQKRLGLIKKPMMVVPNHMLQQFAREWIDLYPAARLMVADEKNFHTENRRKFISRVALSDLDGVIITHSAFKLLDLDPAFRQEMIEQELDYLRAAFAEAGGEEGKKSREPKIKQIESKIEKMEQKLEAAMSGAGKDKNVRFDEMGVDMLYVDEAHEFRKLAFTTRRQVKGIDSSGSDLAFDLWMKTRWLEEKKPGRSLVMASGTPVTNTLAELFSVQRFMAPAVLEERGLDEFDAWASMFGQEHTEIEADASGKYAPVTRFSKFVNVPELTQMFREFADVLTSDHLAAMLGDKRPKVKDGSRKIVITPQTNDYRMFKRELAERLADSRAWKPTKEEPNNPDPVIKIIGDGRLASIDMRFIDPSLPSDPDSKLNRMADEVIRVFKETANFEYKDKAGKVEPNKGATQIVFSDLGFGAGVAENRGFNARAWFEKRLRDAGVPPAQVAFMSDHKKSTAKLKLFKDINAGRVRIVVGSSKNMGTGVNAQQRLIALHHLDTPWYPADLEQREGRIVRQGNKNPLVQLYAYSTKGSYDAVMWQMLASKQRFIDQALSGDSSVRSIDDLSESSQFQIATAMTSDDERAIQLAGLRAEIEKLQRLYRAHEEQRMRMRQEYDIAGETIRINERKLPEAQQAAGRIDDLSGDRFRATANGHAFDVRKEFGEALLARFKSYADKLGEAKVKIGEISGFDIMAMGRTGQGHGYQAGVFLDLPEPVVLTESTTADPVGVALKATNAMANLARHPAQMQQRIAEALAKRNALEARITAPFPMSEMLADKIKEAQELEAAMLAGQNKLTGIEREQELEDAWQARTGAITPMFSRRRAYNEPDALPNRPSGNRTVNGAELQALRRAAARLERPQAGIFLRVTEDGRAVATGPKGTRVPDTFRRFAEEHDLVFTAGRIVPNYAPGENIGSGISKKSAPMPIIYRESGALYFGEKGDTVDRTDKSTFSRGNGSGMALRDLSAVVDRVGRGLKNLPKVHVLESPDGLSTKDQAQKALRDFIRRAGAWEDVEGATHEGEIYLFASGLADEARAEHVLATHEITHYGLRGAMGKGLDAALQHVWMNNQNVRKAAAEIKARNGLASNIEATEEVLADLPTSELAKLKGWRRVVGVVRNWLQAHGLTKLAARIDGWLKAGLDEQAQADLFVADLVRAAREWVRSGKGSPLMAGTRLADGRLSEDVAKQEKWLTAEAKARGYRNIEDLAERNYPLLEKLAALWRKKNPADALLEEAKRQYDAVVARYKDTPQWMKAPNGEPTKLNERQWVQTRTQMFKDWFGDFEKTELRDFLNGKPLADLQTSEAPHKGYAALREWAVGIFNDYGNYANNPALGKVLMDERAVRDSMGHGINPFKAVAFKAVPEVIERGRIVYSEQRGDVDSHYISAPVRINGVDDVVTVLVHRDAKTNRMYLHSVSTKESLRDGQVNPGPIQKYPSDPGLSRQGGIFNVLHDALNFKGEASKVIDPVTKEPMVVYHGTYSDFSEFDPSRAGENGISSARYAIEFTSDPYVASHYAGASSQYEDLGHDAGNVMPVFIKVDNPFIVTKAIHAGNYYVAHRISNEIDLFSTDPKKIENSKLYGSDNVNNKILSTLIDFVDSKGIPDGVIVEKANWDAFDSDENTQIIVFSPTQIKSATANRGTFDAGNPDIRFSRASAAQAPQTTAAQRADEIIAKPAATWRPVDDVMRTLTTTVRLDRLTSAVYDKAGQLLDRWTPEQVKSGVVSDYGVPEAVIDRRVQMQGAMKTQIRQAGGLLERLSMLTRAESRLAYEWMNNNDPQAARYFEAQLPPESVKVMEEVRAMIDQLSQEAVKLGQLSPEAFKRNRFAYLHRSYVKHTAELTKQEGASRQRAIAVLGDQYKGRGMSDAVDMAKVKNTAPEWWGRKLQAGKADQGLKGEKFIRLERRQVSGAGVMELEPAHGPGETNRQKPGRLLEVAYWPTGEPIPTRYAGWDEAGAWEVRDTKGDKLIVWRDFTKAERVTMGEIDEARYAIAKTLHGMIHDIETGRYLEWLAQRWARKPGESFNGEIVEASERMRDAFAPGTWVQVPETKIPGTGVLKYGALAGRFLPGPVWNDVRQTVGFRFKPLGETYAAILGAWKTAKTALSPAVHTNNVMANFVMADWHDVTAGHVAKALRIILGASQRQGNGLIGRAGNVASRAGIADAEAAREIIARFQDSGANLGSWVNAELQKDQLEPLLAALENELGTAGESAGAMASVSTIIQLAKAKEYRRRRRRRNHRQGWEGRIPGEAGGRQPDRSLRVRRPGVQVGRLAQGQGRGRQRHGGRQGGASFVPRLPHQRAVDPGDAQHGIPVHKLHLPSRADDARGGRQKAAQATEAGAAGRRTQCVWLPVVGRRRGTTSAGYCRKRRLGGYGDWRRN
jgi:N12 class adenine-specific DNA methylase/predicted ABC-type ATPase